jgi:hypothetical protein
MRPSVLPPTLAHWCPHHAAHPLPKPPPLASALFVATVWAAAGRSLRCTACTACSPITESSVLCPLSPTPPAMPRRSARGRPEMCPGLWPRRPAKQTGRGHGRRPRATDESSSACPSTARPAAAIAGLHHGARRPSSRLPAPALSSRPAAHLSPSRPQARKASRAATLMQSAPHCIIFSPAAGFEGRSPGQMQPLAAPPPPTLDCSSARARGRRLRAPAPGVCSARDDTVPPLCRAACGRAACPPCAPPRERLARSTERERA